MHQERKGGDNASKNNLLSFPPPPLSRHINKLLKAEFHNNPRDDYFTIHCPFPGMPTPRNTSPAMS